MEYAESAMNELLGWYGYCNSNNNDHSTERFNSLTNARMSTPNFAACLSRSASYSSTNQSSNSAAAATAAAAAAATTITTVSVGTSSSNRKRENSLSMDDIDNTTDSMSAVDELTKMSPQTSKDSINAPTTTTTTITTSEKSPLGSQSDECGWCKRVISFGSSEFSASSEGLKFCSESCFTQSRRASYKRAKTCDWCKHIRHAVSYVDFQDGASQLQFCSDKCLNQYKMQIFCKETQAHLDLNPHLKDKGKSSNENLITPDLWMRNCRSRSRSLTPDQRSNDSRTATESPIAVTPTINAVPSIKVAPVSKLLSTEHDASRRQSKDNEPTTNVELKNYSNFAQKSRALRKRRTNRLSSNSSSILGNETINNNDSNNENRNTHGKIHATNLISDPNRICLLQPSLMSTMPPSKISPSSAKNQQIDEPNAAFLQRYQLMSQQSPNLFAINENRSLQNALRQSAPFIAPLIPNAGFPDTGPPPPPPSLSSSSSLPDAMPKILPGQPHPLLKFLPMQRQRSEPPPSLNANRKHSFGPENNPIFLMQQHQKTQALNEYVSHIFGTVTPPSTLLMPYPIILPIPLPIPIPLPYEAFLRAAEVKPTNANYANGVRSSCSTNEDDSLAKNCRKSNANDQPLDFTKDNIANEVLKASDNDESDDDKEDSSRSSNKDGATHIRNELTKFRANRQTANKRSLTKEPTSENNRPLRKRKRVIDCDYMRLRDSNSNDTINSRKSI
ncbi:sine oculis-binding protein homolog isoform X2 [Sitodiplosis mosellana]|uniref:sine oculis-binding protein homolog isoform X2 n=1 Tax=Sitodiplosis mosellana TaxID=263140 RepID=UPI002444BA64|nr:sine oculis-binding protein homolog isoform X2 [Sitodiplosis mosellana]